MNHHASGMDKKLLIDHALEFDGLLRTSWVFVKFSWKQLPP